MLELSVIIVNYNTKDYLKRLLKSLQPALRGMRSEVIVVDNNSTDGSQLMVKEKFTWVRLIKARRNLGFSRANNLALKKARGEFLLLLNSDTEVFKDSLSQSLAFMQTRPKIGLLTCRVELADGNLDPACHRGFPTPWASLTYFFGLEKLLPQSRLFGQYHQGWKNLTESHQIDSPSGCFFLICRRALNEVGLLDERFFIYAEDLDYALRLKQAGWQVWYYPQVKIIHYKKRSGRSNQNKPERIKASQHFFQTMAQFYKKHYLNHYPKLVKFLALFAIWLLEKVKTLLIYIFD